MEHVSHNDFVALKASQLQYVNEEVKQNLLKSAQIQENYQHHMAKKREFSPGDLVFLCNKDCDRYKPTTKRRYNESPFPIVKQHSDVDFSIIDPLKPNVKRIKIHSQRLLPFKQRKKELDYFHSVMKNPQEVSSPILPKKQKPHAKFDGNPDVDLLWGEHILLQFPNLTMKSKSCPCHLRTTHFMMSNLTT